MQATCEARLGRDSEGVSYPLQVARMLVCVCTCCRWALEDQEDEQRYRAAAVKSDHQELEQQQQEEAWLPRHVLLNPAIRCAHVIRQ